MVLALNGLPVATIELKNPGTGQTWRHAIRQFQNDRDPRAPLFDFKKRALVHFAADSEEVHMTTRLAGEKTFFLPFNRGSHPGKMHCGKGNPQHKSGYRTGYFWEEVLQFDSFLDILGHFMFLEKKDEKIEDGNGGHRWITRDETFLATINSTPSANLYRRQERRAGKKLPDSAFGGERQDEQHFVAITPACKPSQRKRSKIFDCVIVVTDRQVLDRQLQDAIYQIEHAQGVVKAIDENSQQLAAALVDGTKIVITTLQKFPFVLRGLLRTAGAESLERATDDEKKKAREWQEEIAKRRYAVIVDEAHSSQSGKLAGN